MVWLTDIMELQFAGAMLALAVDVGKKHYGKYRSRVAGAVAVLFAKRTAHSLVTGTNRTNTPATRCVHILQSLLDR
jgi:hypothetical protein